MLFLLLFAGLLVMLLFLGVVVFTEYGVVFVGFPVLVQGVLFLLLLLLTGSLLVIFVVHSGDDVELFWVVIYEGFFAFYWQFYLAILEVEIG